MTRGPAVLLMDFLAQHARRVLTYHHLANRYEAMVVVAAKQCAPKHVSGLHDRNWMGQVEDASDTVEQQEVFTGFPHRPIWHLKCAVGAHGVLPRSRSPVSLIR